MPRVVAFSTSPSARLLDRQPRAGGTSHVDAMPPSSTLSDGLGGAGGGGGPTAPPAAARPRAAVAAAAHAVDRVEAAAVRRFGSGPGEREHAAARRPGRRLGRHRRRRRLLVAAPRASNMSGVSCSEHRTLAPGSPGFGRRRRRPACPSSTPVRLAAPPGGCTGDAADQRHRAARSRDVVLARSAGVGVDLDARHVGGPRPVDVRRGHGEGHRRRVSPDAARR